MTEGDWCLDFIRELELDFAWIQVVAKLGAGDFERTALWLRGRSPIEFRDYCKRFVDYIRTGR